MTLKREPNAAAQVPARPSEVGNDGPMPDRSGPALAAPDVASMVKRLLEDAEWNWISEDNAGFSAELISNLQHTATLEREAAALLAKLGQGWVPEQDRFKRRPSIGQCKCEQHEIPIGVDGINWYWQRHSREACTLELPNRKCWCGLLRSEHIKGHAEGVEPPAPGASDE
jgi:hypothetical protein